MTSTRFPRSPEAIDPTWLTLALRDAGALDSGRVASCTVVPLAAKSATGRLYRVELQCADAPATAPTALIAKLASSDANVRRAAAGGYAKEVCFYRELGHDPGIGVPRCYGASFDADTGELLLLLEELAGPPAKRARLELAERTVAELAPFHARHWRAPVLERAWLHDERTMRELAAAFAQAVPVLRSALGDALPAAFALVAERCAADVPAMFAALQGAPPTLIHGDLHLQQVYWSARGRFAVLDWQTASVSSAVIDVSRVLVSSTDPATQADHELRILDDYHRSLVRHGVDDYPRERMLEDYRRSILYSVFVHTVGAHQLDLTQFQARSAAQGRAWTDRFFGWVDAALVRHDVPARVDGWLARAR